MHTEEQILSLKKLLPALHSRVLRVALKNQCISESRQVIQPWSWEHTKPETHLILPVVAFMPLLMVEIVMENDVKCHLSKKVTASGCSWSKYLDMNH